MAETGLSHWYRVPKDWELVEGSFLVHLASDGPGVWCGYPIPTGHGMSRKPGHETLVAEAVTCTKCLKMEIQHGFSEGYKDRARDRLKELGWKIGK